MTLYLMSVRVKQNWTVLDEDLVLVVSGLTANITLNSTEYTESSILMGEGSSLISCFNLGW